MDIREELKNGRFYLDGGMGTMLYEKGLQSGERPEEWNLSHPEIITQIHKSYFDAGSNLVCANTFGANLFSYDREKLEEIVTAAIVCAKKAAALSDTPQKKYVALDMGPLGRLLKPYGTLDFEDAVSMFATTVQIGVKQGVDVIVIETMNDSYETKAAVLAAKENSDLPVFVTNAYGEDGKLMTGASPLAMLAMLEGLGVDAIGVNCSLGPKQLMGVVKELLQHASVPVIAKPNAGLPKNDGVRTYYDVDPKEFSVDMAEMAEEGVCILGGCCGTTPQYIKAMVQATRDIALKEITEKKETLVSSYTHAVVFGNKPILIGERINPTGKKRFKQALQEQDMDYILNEGLNQEEKGVQILDVNVGLPGIDEGAMMEKTVCELQAVTALPLQIDTSNMEAMEKALRIYNGKAMINSVNGKQEVMEQVFPLVKKYGGLVVALTLDEDGIPTTAEKRIEIAKKIIKVAGEYGISTKDLIFDTLCMSVSADVTAPMETLKALHYIKEEMKLPTVLGVSNISFGLPRRDIINSNFFAFALEEGLSAGIINPYALDMQKAYHSYLLLHNLDENCDGYIEFATNCPDEVATVKKAENKKEGSEGTLTPLQTAVVKGLKEKAGNLCAELLANKDALAIVNEEIVPALDIVGKGFENKTMFLPQLLMSAEAAKAAFENIKAAILKSGASQEMKSKFVIATVKGDIHDIGKNIVKVLLENYGFDVIDLGKDVSPEDVVEAVLSEEAPMCGLSALMTTTVPAMEETIVQLKEKAPQCKIIVGGAVLNREYAARIGADYYSKDAMETVRYAIEYEERK
ncbi:MAG: homocysteine S-methyltransferase family protein [Lachnospiraceae bacterium]|nr:homocysteine S-methyltransferase family protein [Lachnospiraceae bacterium]